MTVGELKKLLESVTDDTVVLVSGNNANYQHNVHCSKRLADEYCGGYFEYFGAAKCRGIITEVLVIE
jgi:hypothetical protein